MRDIELRARNLIPHQWRRRGRDDAKDYRTRNHNGINKMMQLPCSLLLLFVLMSSYRVASFVMKQQRKRLQSTRMMSTSENVAFLEVEQKFALDKDGSRLQTRLSELNFHKKGEVDMVDWYFDTPDPNWLLTPKDCWLRCRETVSGSTWQLKRGRRHDGGSTVYEELEDEEAIEASISMLPISMIPESDMDVVILDEFEGKTVPRFPQSTSLVPFARIETHRSSWAFAGDNDAYDNLTVDLDGTQYGYMVGEVEAVVYNENDIPLAKSRINALVREITEDQDASNHVPVGKLEHYMIRNRPEHYKACIEGGSITDKSL